MSRHHGDTADARHAQGRHCRVIDASRVGHYCYAPLALRRVGFTIVAERCLMPALMPLRHKDATYAMPPLRCRRRYAAYASMLIIFRCRQLYAKTPLIRHFDAAIDFFFHIDIFADTPLFQGHVMLLLCLPPCCH